MIYLFVLDDSLTSLRFTTRTEELTKCYEPLQKLRVRLGTCKKVQVGKDQEKAQSEKDSHSKNRVGKKNKLTIRYLYLENIS